MELVLRRNQHSLTPSARKYITMLWYSESAIVIQKECGLYTKPKRPCLYRFGRANSSSSGASWSYTPKSKRTVWGAGHIILSRVSDQTNGLDCLLVFTELTELATTSNYNALTNSCNLLPTTAHTKSSVFTKSSAVAAWQQMPTMGVPVLPYSHPHCMTAGLQLSHNYLIAPTVHSLANIGHSWLPLAINCQSGLVI
jgi:hypothetical protein